MGTMALWQGMLLIGVRVFLVTAAENLQRYAQRCVPPRRTLNVMGVLIGVCSAPLELIAYSVAPQSMLAPFGMLSLVLNMGVAHLHGDVLRPRDAFATVLVIAGSLICLLHGAASNEGPASLPPMAALLLYAVCVSVCCGVLGCLLAARRSVQGRKHAIMSAMLGGILGSSVLVASKVLAASLTSHEATLASVALACVPLLLLVPLHLFILNRGFGQHPLVFMSPVIGTVGMLANVTTGCLLYNEIPVAPTFWRRCYGTLLWCLAALHLGQQG